MPLLLNPEQAAEELGVSRAQLYKLLSPRGPIANVRIGASRRIPSESLVDYVEELKRQAVPA